MVKVEQPTTVAQNSQCSTKATMELSGDRLYLKRHLSILVIEKLYH